MILYQIVATTSKRLFLSIHFALHWREELRDLGRFWLLFYFLPWKSYKIQTDQPRTELRFQILWKPKCIPSNDEHNCFLDEQYNSKIFLNPYMLWAWLQRLLCHSSTLMIGTLCPISTLNHQLTNLEQTHNRCLLHCERWTVKGRDCVSALHSFNEINYQSDEWTKHLLGWRVEWSLETRNNGWNCAVCDEL